MSEAPIIGIIGGSGLYNLPLLQNSESIEVDTPFGKPSSPIVKGYLNDHLMFFLARHGVGHFITPSNINYRANIHAFKQLGVTNVIAVSACGSLREGYAPGHIVIPDQLFDFSHKRPRTFFDNELVAHVSTAEPFCPSLSKLLFDAVESCGGTVHQGGTYITIEGPRFSTKAESHTFRSWGMSIIGMTASPEAFLAREAEMCYAIMAHVTDYDVWHESETPVTVDMVIRTLHKNTQLAQDAILKLVSGMCDKEACTCDSALKDALISDLKAVPQKTRDKLSLLTQKYLD